MDSKEEKKNKRTGALVSVGVHLALVILFFFLLAWREPNPPLPEYGIELNFGLVDEGSGEEATPDPTSDNTTDQPTEEVIEETVEEVTESAEETADEPTEEVTEEAESTESEVVTTAQESPDVREVQEEVKETKPAQEEVKQDSKPVEETKEDKPQEVNPSAVFTKPDDGKEGAEGEGDDADAEGDKGDPKGLDDRASYKGTPGGGGGGPALEITGWYWDKIPDKKDDSDQSGRIKFSFRIDEDGYVTSVRTLESTVSPNVVAFYKRQLENTTFSQTNNAPPPPSTEGIVTFVIKSK